jgi:hypothetical protein
MSAVLCYPCEQIEKAQYEEVSATIPRRPRVYDGKRFGRGKYLD